MGLEQNNEQHYREVVDKFINPTVSTQMTTRDYVVRPSASAPITITLPPVAEAKGRFYSIVAQLATAVNTITVHDLHDSEGWPGDAVLNEKGQGVLYYSDGMKWIGSPIGVFGTSFTSARTDATTTIRAGTIGLTLTGASTTNSAEALKVTLTTNVNAGVYVNAITGVLDFQTLGHVEGIAGVICAELDMPGSTIAAPGQYTCFEAEINIPTNSIVPVIISCISLQVWGTNATQFDHSGYLFDIVCSAAATTHFFQANTAADATHALRIRINGVAYYIMLTNVGA